MPPQNKNFRSSKLWVSNDGSLQCGEIDLYSVAARRLQFVSCCVTVVQPAGCDVGLWQWTWWKLSLVFYVYTQKSAVSVDSSGRPGLGAIVLLTLCSSAGPHNSPVLTLHQLLVCSEWSSFKDCVLLWPLVPPVNIHTCLHLHTDRFKSQNISLQKEFFK